ncbi:mannosyltransferase [Kalmusia sp. IMI 367209]|nr:mannosyltransferase [Kalmusia sp. IMI 367209]
MILGSTRSSAITIHLGIPSFTVFLYLLLWSSQRNVTPNQFFAHEHNATSTLSVPNSQKSSSGTNNVTTQSQSAPPDIKASIEFHDSNDEFWNTLSRALEDARPKCPPIVHTPNGLNATDKKHEPLRPHKPRPDNINMTNEAEKELMRAHYSMRKAAFRLGPDIPFVRNTTGIVVTSSPKQMPYLLVSLRMLRKTESQLPVELFVADQSEYNATMCEGVLRTLNTRCVVMSQIFATKIEHFQYKVFAILLSSFQNVLFLDSDAFPIHDPTPLFTLRPFSSHGLVVFPDIWGSTVSAHYYHIAGIPEVPISTPLASETGQVLIDKSKHQESFLMTLYYNYYGPSHYYTILSQGSAGPGDKDTFIQGATAVDLPFYAVKTSEMGLGRSGGFGGEGFHMLGMAQRDPSEDFLYGPPMPNHLHEEDSWDDDDAADAEGSVALTRPRVPRPMFVHQMIFKIRPGLILRADVNSYKNAEGGWQRMWTSDEDSVKTFGYDAEKVLWEVLEHVSCLDGIEPEACDKLKEYRAAVFGGSKSSE